MSRMRVPSRAGCAVECGADAPRPSNKDFVCKINRTRSPGATTVFAIVEARPPATTERRKWSHDFIGALRVVVEGATAELLDGIPVVSFLLVSWSAVDSGLCVASACRGCIFACIMPQRQSGYPFFSGSLHNDHPNIRSPSLSGLRAEEKVRIYANARRQRQQTQNDSFFCFLRGTVWTKYRTMAQRSRGPRSQYSQLELLQQSPSRQACGQRQRRRASTNN